MAARFHPWQFAVRLIALPIVYVAATWNRPSHSRIISPVTLCAGKEARWLFQKDSGTEKTRAILQE